MKAHLDYVVVFRVLEIFNGDTIPTWVVTLPYPAHARVYSFARAGGVLGMSPEHYTVAGVRP